MKCMDCGFCELVTGNYHDGICNISLPGFIKTDHNSVPRKVYKSWSCDLGKQRSLTRDKEKS